MEKRRLLALTLERSVSIGIVAALLGVILIIFAGETDGAASVVLANVGTAILTTGLVGIIYDLLLRERLVGEVLNVVGVRESLAAFGLRQVSENRTLDLETLLEEASELTVLPLDPLQWIDQDFSTVCRRARARALDVTVLIPANESPYLRILAERLGKEEMVVEQILDQAARGDLGNAWDSSHPNAGSRLRVRRFGGIPATGLIRTDRIIAVEVGPLIRYGPLDRQGFVVQADRPNTPLDLWVKEQLDREEDDENLSAIDERPQVAPLTPEETL